MTLLPHYQMFIDGAWCEGASGQVRDSINPERELFGHALPVPTIKMSTARLQRQNAPLWHMTGPL